MKINNGLMAGQVLQRNGNNRGGAVITGSAKGNGTVELRVLKGRKIVQPWSSAGMAAEKSFSAELTNLKSGGPYRVELRVRSRRKTVDTLSVGDIFVGDVWILAGQSNMQGIGNLCDGPKPHPLVRAFYMRDEWSLAEGKIHRLDEAVDVVHNGYGDGPERPSKREVDKRASAGIKGIGPGNAFGLEMRRRTRVPQGLIACAHGGTSMAQWSPELLEKGRNEILVAYHLSQSAPHWGIAARIGTLDGKHEERIALS